MADRFYPATFLEQKFHCICCGVYAKQAWSTLKADGYRVTQGRVPAVAILPKVSYFSESLPDAFSVSKCDHCSNITIWLDKKIIHPRKTAVELPNDDLSAEIKELYNEAALVLNDSPRAAAALLRLALQLLLASLGGKGKSIDTDIKYIVAGGVDPQVQKAMDIVRVFGNNGAHPGEIQLNEGPDLVKSMFELINFIASKMITSKREIDDLFESLPGGAKEAIEKRDKSSPRGKTND